MTITDDRKKEIDFSEPYIDSNQSIADPQGLQARPTQLQPQRQEGRRAVRHDRSRRGPRRTSRAPRSSTFKTATDALTRLQAGKVDAVVNDLPVSAYLVKDSSKGLESSPRFPTGEQYGFAVSKENPELLAAVNAALAKVRASGEYNTIYEKWFGVPK